MKTKKKTAELTAVETEPKTRSMSLIDPDDGLLSISNIAWAMLQLLRTARIKVNAPIKNRTLVLQNYAWYNGRERGVAFTLSSYGLYESRKHDTFVVTFARNRNSDEVRVQTFWTESKLLALNPPTPALFNNAHKLEEKFFKEEELVGAVNYVEEVITSAANKIASFK